MPRPRSFDEDAVLDGYAGSSVRDLEAATGLAAPSLYNAFGDKHALFARCLDRYLDASMRARIARLEAGLAPRAAIATFFEEIVARSIEDSRGCLLINTALELAPHDAALAATVTARLGELEGFFLRCVRAGQAAGSIHPGRAPRDLARLLLTTVLGLRVLARSRAAAVTLRGAARQALALLDPPSVETPR
jgi:TetR/AcrR family transcriptional repressor of nem operon